MQFSNLYLKIRQNFSVTASASEDKAKLLNFWIGPRKPYQKQFGLCADSIGSICHINTPQVPFSSRSASSPCPFTASQTLDPLLSLPKLPPRLYTLHPICILVSLLQNTAHHHHVKYDLAKLFSEVQYLGHTNTCSSPIKYELLTELLLGARSIHQRLDLMLWNLLANQPLQ